MKTRILLDGRVVEELEIPKTLTVKTRCPDKWILIDMETGEQYTGNTTDDSNNWKKLQPLEWVRVDY